MSSTWLSVADAQTTMQECVDALDKSEEVALNDALDRVLSEPVYATIDVPGYDNSAMDGYAFHTESHATTLTLVGEALAGHPFEGEIPRGSCIRIMTGARVPADANTVIAQENVTVDGDQIHLNESVTEGSNIRRAGSDISAGATVIAGGQRLNAIHIGLLAAIGIARVRVIRKLCVGLVSNGDELVAPGQPLRHDAQIYDSNRYTLYAMLQRLNVNIVDLGHVEDDPAALETVFAHGMKHCDVILSSAGVSVGDADYTKDVLQKLGSIDFWRIAIKPGKPFAFGRLDKTWFCGLPGNPVAAVVTMNQLVQPMLRRLAGETLTPPQVLLAKARVDIKKRPGRTDFQRGVFHQENEQIWAEPIGSQSSAVLTSVAQANCFLVLEQERDMVRAGESITIQPFDTLLT